MFKFLQTFILIGLALLMVACGQGNSPKENATTSVAPVVTEPKTAVGPATPATPVEKLKPMAKKLEGTITLYTDQHEAIDRTLVSDFERFSGLKVKVVEEKDALALVARLAKEGASTSADLVLLQSMNYLNLAKSKGLLQKLISAKAEAQIPEEYRDEDRNWFGLTRNATVVVYQKDQVKAEELSYYEYLSRQNWQGKLLLPSIEHPQIISWFASLLAWDDLGRAEKYCQGFANNLAKSPFADEQALLQALAAGEGTLALVSTRAAGQFFAEASAATKAKLAVFYPKNMGGATHFDLAGIGICKHAKNPALASKFIEFLGDKEVQTRYSTAKLAYPANTMVQTPTLLQAWGSYHGDDLPFTKLYQHQAKAKRMLQAVTWAKE